MNRDQCPQPRIAWLSLAWLSHPPEKFESRSAVSAPASIPTRWALQFQVLNQGFARASWVPEYTVTWKPAEPT